MRIGILARKMTEIGLLFPSPFPRRMRALFILASLALVFSAPDPDDKCGAYATELPCLQHSECYWCRCAAIPSSCNNVTNAKRLPPAVFVCGNSTNPTCETNKDVNSCTGDVGCVWCTDSNGAPSRCVPFANSTSLPGYKCAPPKLVL